MIPSAIADLRLSRSVVDVRQRLERGLDRVLRDRTRSADPSRTVSAESPSVAGTVLYVRDRLKSSPADAISLANAIGALGGQKDVAALLHGLIAFRRGDADAAWAHFSGVDSRLWAAHAPAEASKAAMRVDPSEAARILRNLANLSPDDLPVQSWYHLTGTALGRSNSELARALYRRFAEAVDSFPDQWRPAAVQRDWLAPWITDHGPHPAPRLSDGHVRFGVLSFGSPERKSSSWNLGDPVQSLASLGHLVRHQVKLHGDPELVDALEYFQSQVPEDLRRPTRADVDVMIVDRDATRFNDIPPNTWMLVIGWWMYPIFGLDYQIPLNENIKPIILSFYCRHPSFLTDDAVNYLKRYGPVGCRDWTTVDLLLKAGVPAFFSGCITSTVSTVFDRHRTIDRDETIYVEAPDAPLGATTASQMDDGMRDQSPAQQLRRVHTMLDGYRHFAEVHTKRLHCYMPTRSLGMDVKFLPNNPADPRYPGLAGITDDEFTSIRNGINDLLEPIMTAILGGEEESTIRQLWRDATADRVAAARRRFAAPVAELPAAMDDSARMAKAKAAIRTVTESRAHPQSAVTIVTSINRAQILPFQVLVKSVMSRSTRPIEWLVVTTDVSQSAFSARSPLGALARRVDNLSLRNVDAKQVPKVALTLSLPDLVESDRVVQLSAESLCLADVAELAEVDLEGRPAAMARSADNVFGSGMEELRSAAARLRDRELAAELRREALIRQPRDLPSLRTDVVVLDAARLRAERLGELARRYARHLKLSNRQQLLLLIGANHAPLPDRWAQTAAATQLPADAGLVHFAHQPKPWEPGVGYQNERWIAERDAGNT
ncbi:hypothetical protein FOE78_12160 [Microlunatus elymi]|uniref:Uncharacterized protein n=1 Tax=Microlunatus elymi TaxID=2596828 RepID=A0A516PZF4_9ACTN|nr:hypothetical protein [Microlunatus elymi]QDP96559.1 hypothetical protein FOE78_12160 [Microlunatus elymi]